MSKKFQAFSKSALDKTFVEQDFKASGFKESDRRDVSQMQNAKMPRAIDTVQAKEYIYDRMLNTMDFYQTLEGSYTHDERWSDSKFTVAYAVVNGDNPKSYEKLQYEGATKWSENIYKDGLIKQAEFMPDTLAKSGENKMNMVRASFLDAAGDRENDTISLVRATSRKQIDQEGVPVWYYRQETNGLAFSRESISPQEMALGFLNNFSAWQIEKQEQFIGRNCYVLSGTLSGDYSDKLKTASYQLWIDTETGVLLKSRQWNANGDLTDSITTTAFQANQAIDDNRFSKAWFDQQ